MLEKLTTIEYVPGRPEIPEQPERTVCDLPPGTGGGGNDDGYITVCTTIQILVGMDNGPPSYGNPGPFPKPIYITSLVCRRERAP